MVARHPPVLHSSCNRVKVAPWLLGSLAPLLGTSMQQTKYPFWYDLNNDARIGAVRFLACPHALPRRARFVRCLVTIFAPTVAAVLDAKPMRCFLERFSPHLNRALDRCFFASPNRFRRAMHARARGAEKVGALSFPLSSPARRRGGVLRARQRLQNGPAGQYAVPLSSFAYLSSVVLLPNPPWNCSSPCSVCIVCNCKKKKIRLSAHQMK